MLLAAVALNMKVMEIKIKHQLKSILMKLDYNI